MECSTFQSLINDFLFDKIEYSDDLEEFLDHAEDCKKCNEELLFYYSIRRNLGDISAPDESMEILDMDKELSNIKEFYRDIFSKRRAKKKARKSILIIIVVMASIVLAFIALHFANIII